MLTSDLFNGNSGGGGILGPGEVVAMSGHASVSDNTLNITVPAVVESFRYSIELGGGGVYGIVTMGDHASVLDNTINVIVADGLNINSAGSAVSLGGGGVFGTVAIYGDSVISGNAINGPGYGGGVYGSLTMGGNAEMSDNTVGEFGGGAFITHTPGAGGDSLLAVGLLEDLAVVKGNCAGEGGGIYVMGKSGYPTPSLTMQDFALVSANSAEWGGGIRGDITMWDNTAVSNNIGVYGGGIYGGITMYGNARVSNNIASMGGGVFMGFGGTSTMYDNATVSGNTATGDNENSYLGVGMGGGVCIDYGTFSMRDNSTVSGNSAEDGGGVHVFLDAIFNLRDNATVFGNTAANTGGGVSVRFFDMDNPAYLYQGGGVIYGNNAEGDASLRSTAPTGAALYKYHANRSIAEYGSFNGDDWVKAGDILPNVNGANTDNTLRVVNGVLQ